MKTERNPKEKTRQLKEFFAVTMTSVYHVKMEEGHAVMVKIALNGESSIPLGGKLVSGYRMAIGANLYAYFSGCNKSLEDTNTRDWGGQTSPVVALFKNKKAALDCSKKDNLERCDERWKKQTINVLHSIGENHPHFNICITNSLRLINHEEWMVKK